MQSIKGHPTTIPRPHARKESNNVPSFSVSKATSTDESITTCATPTPTTDALNDLLLLKLSLWNTADTRCAEIGFLCLDATETAKLVELLVYMDFDKSGEGREKEKMQVANLLITLFLPFGNEVCVRVVVFQEPVVELFGDCFFFVVEVVDVS